LRHRNRLPAIALAAASAILPVSLAHAYTAAGDRVFSATVLLPQIGPSDEAYLTTSTVPTTGGRTTIVEGTYSKTFTERTGIEIDEGYQWLNHRGDGTSAGWANQNITLRYTPVIDLEHEFLLTVGLQQEFGNTGTQRIGANPNGATTPTVYFGKGLGDFDVGYLRPLAVLGQVGYQASDGGARPDQVVFGAVIQYSIPYLESKVEMLNLPEFLRTLTPMVEYAYATTTTPSHGQSTTSTVAPGFAISGTGWEFALEALVPATHTTGTGAGVLAQFHLSLDFFFPDTVGKPLFASGGRY
jgi:hypothetical protein